MGLFGFGKKKALTHEDKVEIVYKSFSEDMVDLFFPGGERQVSRILKSLAKVYKLDLASYDTNMYQKIIKTYVDVQTRKVLSTPDDRIISCLLVTHSDIIKDELTARMVIAFVEKNSLDSNYSIETNDDMMDIELTAMAMERIERRKTTINMSTEQSTDPEYGLVENKPIYTRGVQGSRAYLEALKTSNGEPLKWDRLYSISVKGISGMIDVYESSLMSGEKYRILYVNMYGTSNSTIIPQGVSR